MGIQGILFSETEKDLGVPIGKILTENIHLTFQFSPQIKYCDFVDT